MSIPNLTMMRQTVIVEPIKAGTGAFVGFDAQEQYDAPVTLRAKVEVEQSLVRRPDGQEAIANRIAYIHSPQLVITEKARVTLPDGTQPAILRVEGIPDGYGRTRMYAIKFGDSRRTG